MFQGVLAKFTSSEQLKNILLKTGDRVFVECNGKDSYWRLRLYDLGILDHSESDRGMTVLLTSSIMK